MGFSISGDVGAIAQENFQKLLAQRLLEERQAQATKQQELENQFREREFGFREKEAARAEEDQAFQREERVRLQNERERLLGIEQTEKNVRSDIGNVMQMPGLTPEQVEAEARGSTVRAGIDMPEQVTKFVGEAKRERLLDPLRQRNPNAARKLELGQSPSAEDWMTSDEMTAKQKRELQQAIDEEEARQKIAAKYREGEHATVKLENAAGQQKLVKAGEANQWLDQGWHLYEAGTSTAAGKAGGRGAEGMAALAKALPIMNEVDRLSKLINTIDENEYGGKGWIGGPHAAAAGAVRGVASKVGLDPNVDAYESMIQAFTPMIARALGHVGVLTEQDVQSARRIFPAPGEPKGQAARKMARAYMLMRQLSEGKVTLLPEDPTTPLSMRLGAAFGDAPAATPGSDSPGSSRGYGEEPPASSGRPASGPGGVISKYIIK